MFPHPILLEIPSQVPPAADLERVHAAAARGDWAGVRQLGSASQTASWQALHTGHWSAVDVAWRTAYAVACYYVATAEVEGVRQLSAAAGASAAPEGTCAAALRAALRHADLGLMLGDTTCRKPLLRLAERLETALSPSREGTGCGRGQRPAASAGPCTSPSWPSAGESAPRRPLSGQRAVPRLSRPSLPFFYNECMQPASPALLLGVLDGWPAMGCRR